MNESKKSLSGSSHQIEAKFDRLDELASLLVDEVISEDQVRELESLLTGDGELRGRYVENIQLHCDLIDYFGAKQPQQKPASPILGLLGGEGSDLHLPVCPPKAGQ